MSVWFWKYFWNCCKSMSWKVWFKGRNFIGLDAEVKRTSLSPGFLLMVDIWISKAFISFSVRISTVEPNSLFGGQLFDMRSQLILLILCKDTWYCLNCFCISSFLGTSGKWLSCFWSWMLRVCKQQNYELTLHIICRDCSTICGFFVYKQLVQ